MRSASVAARLLGLVFLAACGSATGPVPPAAPPPPPALPITGQAVPELASFDQIFPALMKTWKIPGGAVAVTFQGRLVYARGYGYADTLAKTPVAPDALFRIASVSKPITAVAALKLAEQG